VTPTCPKYVPAVPDDSALYTFERRLRVRTPLAVFSTAALRTSASGRRPPRPILFAILDQVV
jgi:hypothetical protein